MSDPWTDAIEEAYASAPLDDDIISTLEMRHPSLTEPIRVALWLGDIVKYDDDGQPIFGLKLRLEDDAPLNKGEIVTFVSCAFDFSLPDQQEGQLPSVEIGVDNVAHVISPQLDTLIGIKSKLEVIYREYLLSDTNTPQYILRGLTMSNIKSNLTRITGTASFADLVNLNFPSKVYRPAEFPGLLQ
jgi:hypothetical protein